MTRYIISEFDNCLTGEKMITITDSWTGNIFADNSNGNIHYEEYLLWRE